MPAIQLARLKHQTAHLVDLFSYPPEFIHEFYQLLDFYADRTHRPGQSGEPPPLLESFKVPRPVIRQIFIELKPLAESNPEAALLLAEALWAEPYLEPRIMAALVLGSISPTSPEAFIGRVKDWVSSGIDEQLMSTVLNQGLEKIRENYPDVLISFIDQWLHTPDINSQLIGLRVLLPLLSAPQYENLPAFFLLLAPFVRKAPLSLRPEIQEALQALAYRSPKETAYFLHQNLEAPENPDTAMLTRQSLPCFPPDLQAGLRSALRETPTRKRS